MKTFFLSISLGICFAWFILGVGWATLEMKAHYKERQYLFEWELRNRQIVGVLDSIERMIEIAKR